MNAIQLNFHPSSLLSKTEWDKDIFIYIEIMLFFDAISIFTVKTLISSALDTFSFYNSFLWLDQYKYPLNFSL